MAEDVKLTEKSEGANDGVYKTEVKVDMSSVIEMKEQYKALVEQMSNLAKVISEMKQITPVVSEVKENKTKGIVTEEKKAEEKKDESIVIEKADFGKGFQIWRDYNKECKFKRLAR